MNYDRAKEIDDATSRQEAAENYAGVLQDKLDATQYIFIEVLKQLGYGPAQCVEEDTQSFIDEMIETHGGEDDVVAAIVEGLGEESAESEQIRRDITSRALSSNAPESNDLVDPWIVRALSSKN